VRECLGLTVAAEDPDAYRAAHRDLGDLLPGRGPLQPRLAAYRRRDAVPAARLRPAVAALSAALRARVAGPYGLPAGEAVEYRLVADAPWSALHGYLGGHRSTVRINAGAAPGAGRLPRLVAHEAYPGHHVECIRTEAYPVARGRVELAVTVLGSSQSVISEGLAEEALRTATGSDWGAWAAGVLAAVGVCTDGEQAQRLADASAVLRSARLDAALLLHGDRPCAEAAEAHLRRWLLLDGPRARRVVDALARPLWRGHVAASVEGGRLLRSWLGRPGTDPVAEHLRLLDAPRTPTALRSQMGTDSTTACDGR
jgi:hypothetical protein